MNSHHSLAAVAAAAALAALVAASALAQGGAGPATASGNTPAGTTAARTTVPGTTVPGTTVPGTTAAGTTAAGTTAAGTTAAGTTAAGVALPRGIVPNRAELPMSAFNKLDADNKGYVTRDDVRQLDGFGSAFEQADQNRDGRLNASEFNSAWSIYTGNKP